MPGTPFPEEDNAELREHWDRTRNVPMIFDCSDCGGTHRDTECPGSEDEGPVRSFEDLLKEREKALREIPRDELDSLYSSDEVVQAIQRDINQREAERRKRMESNSLGLSMQKPDCLNQNAHNFDIGPTHAVCKMCCKVVPLISYPKEPEWWHTRREGRYSDESVYWPDRQRFDGLSEDMGI